MGLQSYISDVPWIMDETRTLGSLVRPEIGHSLMFAGASMDVTFAFSIKGSLMMFTTNSFVSLIFSRVSLWPAENDTVHIGG